MPDTRALFVHGGGGGGGGWEWNVWRRVWEAHGIRCHTPDLMPAPSGLAGTTWADYAAQIAHALRNLAQPRVLVGASLGGLLALQAATAVEVRAVIAINPLPPAPWQQRLPQRDWPDRVRWARDARLWSTRRAMPDADDAAALYAYRRWRDESGQVLRAAYAGIAVEKPHCPLLMVASRQDGDVPPGLTRALAEGWQAHWLQTHSDSHVGPLLGRTAAATAAQAVAWLNALDTVA